MNIQPLLPNYIRKNKSVKIHVPLPGVKHNHIDVLNLSPMYLHYGRRN